MIGSVTEAQAQMAEIGKRRKRRGDAGRTADEPAVSDAHVAAVAGLDALDDLPESKAVHTGPEPAMPVQSGEISGQDFRRGALAEGHAAESPQSGPPCGYPVPEGQPAPGVFDRGYLTAGQAADSPANRGMPPQVVPSGLAITHGGGPMAAMLAQHGGSGGLVMTSIPPHGGQ